MKFDSIRKYACVPFLPDGLEIESPKSHRLDNTGAPGDSPGPAKAGYLKTAVAPEKAAGVLKYKRNFHFGANRKGIFPICCYQDIRGLFGEFHKAGPRIATLKQE